jgi:hypothetical protein
MNPETQQDQKAADAGRSGVRIMTGAGAALIARRRFRRARAG